MASKHLPRRTKTESGLENELQIQGEGRKSQKPLPPVVGMKSYGKCQSHWTRKCLRVRLLSRQVNFIEK